MLYLRLYWSEQAKLKNQHHLFSPCQFVGYLRLTEFPAQRLEKYLKIITAAVTKTASGICSTTPDNIAVSLSASPPKIDH